MAYTLTKEEKDAHVMMKNLISKPKAFEASDFKPGKMVMFYYNPKFNKNPYDATPLCLVLKRSRSYTLGLNFHWMPKPLRKIFIGFIYKQNKNNIKLNLPLVIDYKMIKSLFLKYGAPAVRLYINRRISPKGVVVPQNEFNRVIDLRAEHFINITAEQAWAIALKNYKGKK